MRPVPHPLGTRLDFRAAAMRLVRHPLDRQPDFRAGAIRPVPLLLCTRPDFRAGATSPTPHPQSSADAPRSLARHPAVPRSPGTNLTPGEA